ncbi:MAG: hypothetical protein JXB62_01930 [Pirellulales bacterium]|nr:hypothetical protein [Pirellulales bacterium]
MGSARDLRKAEPGQWTKLAAGGFQVNCGSMSATARAGTRIVLPTIDVELRPTRIPSSL